MSQIKTQILHQEYLLTCPEGQEAQLLEAVERVDQQFQQMRNTTKLRSRERICVLLAVNLAFDNLVLRHQLQELQQQLAAAQANHEGLLSNADADRLQALQAQAQLDQARATELLHRLDHALADNPTASPELLSPLSIAPLQAPTDIAVPDASADNLDNAKHVELPQPSMESL